MAILERPNLAQIELPAERGAHVRYWRGNVCYTIMANQPASWMVLAPERPGGLPILGLIIQVGDSFSTLGEPPERTHTSRDWREIVRGLQ